MTINGKVHCLFEQSGTFKNEFIKLGIPAEDYDIQNNFGQTDHVIDLFGEIESAWGGQDSIFNTITKDDLVMAFFPCIYFSQQNTTFFDGTNINLEGMDVRERNELIIKRANNRHEYYLLALKFFTLCDTKGLRLVVENPWTSLHYLHNNFPYKPSLIDKNRQLRGDSFRKPTQYWFVNCEPTRDYTYKAPAAKKVVNSLSGHTGQLCDEDRSMISPDYARNFICDNILGKPQKQTQLSLIDIFNNGQ